MANVIIYVPDDVIQLVVDRGAEGYSGYIDKIIRNNGFDSLMAIDAVVFGIEKYIKDNKIKKNKEIKSMANKVELTVMDVLGWGGGDVDHLEGWLTTAEQWNISVSDVLNDIESLGENEKLNINSWFYSVLNSLFYVIMDEFEGWVNNLEEKKDYLSKIEKLKDEFSPFINYLDSSFNNLLGEVDITDENKETVFTQIADQMDKE